RDPVHKKPSLTSRVRRLSGSTRRRLTEAAGPLAVVRPVQPIRNAWGTGIQRRKGRARALHEAIRAYRIPPQRSFEQLILASPLLVVQRNPFVSRLGFRHQLSNAFRKDTHAREAPF